MPILAIIFISLALLMIFLARPAYSLYFLAFSTPIIGWSFYIGRFNLPFIDLIACIALIAFVLRFTYIHVSKDKNTKQQTIKWPLAFPFAIFFIVSLLSVLVSEAPLSSLWYIIRWPLLMYLAYIFLPYNLVSSPKILKNTVIALVISSGLVLLSGYLSLYGQEWQSNFYRLQSISVFGVYLFGANHNLIAEFLNVGVFMILMLRALSKNNREKRFLDSIFALSTIAIIMTFSRAGWLTLALQLSIYAWYYFYLKKYRPANVLLAILGIAIILSPLAWRMIELQKHNVSSTENRWLLTQIAWEAYLDKPYLGHGSGQFINLVNQNLRFKAKYGDPIDSHGMVQKVLAENGIFGLAAWLFIFIYLGKIFYQTYKKYQLSHYWFLPLFLSGFGALFFQFFNTSYYKGKVWLPIALGLAAIKLLEEKQNKKNAEYKK